METHEKIDGNSLIAEFMGFRLITPEMRKRPEDWYNNGKPSSYWENHELKGSRRVLCGENGLMYHSSWDWLMPVVNKIFGLKKDYPIATSDLLETFIFEDIDVVWNRVVNFIKWYNSNAEPTRTTTG